MLCSSTAKSDVFFPEKRSAFKVSMHSIGCGICTVSKIT